MQFVTPLAPAYAEIFVLGMVSVILLVDVFLSDARRGVTYACPRAPSVRPLSTDSQSVGDCGRGGTRERSRLITAG